MMSCPVRTNINQTKGNTNLRGKITKFKHINPGFESILLLLLSLRTICVSHAGRVVPRTYQRFDSLIALYSHRAESLENSPEQASPQRKRLRDLKIFRSRECLICDSSISSLFVNEGLPFQYFFQASLMSKFSFFIQNYRL